MSTGSLEGLAADALFSVSELSNARPSESTHILIHFAVDLTEMLAKCEASARSADSRLVGQPDLQGIVQLSFATLDM